MKKSVVPGENHQTAESKRQVHIATGGGVEPTTLAMIGTDCIVGTCRCNSTAKNHI